MRQALPVIAMLVLLAGASSASASGSDPFSNPEPLPFTKMSPPNGARYYHGTGWLTASFVSPLEWLEANGEVSKRKTLGQDGTLADDYVVVSLGMFPSDANPRRYVGVSTDNYGPGSWSDTPGTYYWQASAYGVDPATGYFHWFVGPVRTLHIVKRCYYVKRHGHRRKVCK
jgi:hypothetical protein